MTDETIPVPAESARKMAVSALNKGVPDLKENGYRITAERIERSASKILAETAGKEGEFASVDGSALSAVTSESFDFSHHRDAARHFLQQYNVWDK